VTPRPFGAWGQARLHFSECRRIQMDDETFTPAHYFVRFIMSHPEKDSRTAPRGSLLERLEPRTLFSVVTWTGHGDGVHWSDAANWNLAHAPLTGDDVVLKGTTVADLSAGVVIRNLTFTGDAALSAPDAQPLAASGNISVTGGDVSVTSPLTLAALNTAVTVAQGWHLTLVAPTTSQGAKLTFAGKGGTTFVDAPDPHTLDAEADITAGSVLFQGHFSGKLKLMGGEAGFLVTSNTLAALEVTGGQLTLTTQQTVLGNLLLGAGSTSNFTTPGAALIAKAGVTLGATLLSDNETLIQKDSAGHVTGTFAGLPEGKGYVRDGFGHRITYVGGDGNDVTATIQDIAGPAAGLQLYDAASGPVDVYRSGGTTTTFTVAFADNAGVSAAGIIRNNALVKVTGPHGFSRFAAFVSLTQVNFSRFVATYLLAAPGGLWDPADAGAYTVTVVGGALKDTLDNVAASQTAGTFYMSPTPLFDERYYLGAHQDVQHAIDAGAYQSGWQHFLLRGQVENFRPSATYSESVYLALNPDVAQAVRAGRFRSGFDHLMRFGIAEKRPITPLFDEAYYLANNHDVAVAVQSGAFTSAFQHFLNFGQFENRSPSAYFDTAYYLAHTPAVSGGVTEGSYRSLFEGFLLGEARRGTPASALFDETSYLSRYPDVAAAVAANKFNSGLEHYLLYGRKEGRTGVGTT
jgi:hypothetical protein